MRLKATEPVPNIPFAPSDEAIRADFFADADDFDGARALLASAKAANQIAKSLIAAELARVEPR